MAAPQVTTHFLPFSLTGQDGRRVYYMGGNSWRDSYRPETLSPHLCKREAARAESRPNPPAPAVGSDHWASLSFSLFQHPIFPCSSSAVRSGRGGHGTCYSRPLCTVAIPGVLVESGITLGWACLPLLDL